MLSVAFYSAYLLTSGTSHQIETRFWTWIAENLDEIINHKSCLWRASTMITLMRFFCLLGFLHHDQLESWSCPLVLISFLLQLLPTGPQSYRAVAVRLCHNFPYFSAVFYVGIPFFVMNNVSEVFSVFSVAGMSRYFFFGWKCNFNFCLGFHISNVDVALHIFDSDYHRQPIRERESVCTLMRVCMGVCVCAHVSVCVRLRTCLCLSRRETEKKNEKWRYIDIDEMWRSLLANKRKQSEKRERKKSRKR